MVYLKVIKQVVARNQANQHQEMILGFHIFIGKENQMPHAATFQHLADIN